MNTKLSLLISILAFSGCAGLLGGGDGKDICIVKAAEGRMIDVIDGEKQKGKGGYMSDIVKRTEVAPGKHTYTFGSTSRAEPIQLTFVCKAGHTYALQKRSAGADIYGTRWVWMIEDARTKEVIVGQNP